MKTSMAQRQETPEEQPASQKAKLVVLPKPQPKMDFEEAIVNICSLASYNTVRDALKKGETPDGTKFSKKKKNTLIEATQQAAKEIAQAKLSGLQNARTFFPSSPAVEKEKREIISLFKAAGHFRKWNGMKGMGEEAKIRQQSKDACLLARIESTAQSKKKQMPYLPPSQHTL